MSRILGHILRLLAILVGYGAAMIAASLFVNLLFFGTIGWFHAQDAALSNAPVWVATAVMASVFGYFAFFPALAAIALGEALARRDWLFWSLAGGVVPPAALALSMARGSETESFAPMLGAVMVAAGVVGGMAYWLVAGRQSGRSMAGVAAAPAQGDR